MYDTYSYIFSLLQSK